MRYHRENKCSNCKLCFGLEKLDYSKGGCKHTPMEGFVCMAFANEGQANWMVGLDRDTIGCEVFTPRRKDEWQ